MADHVLLRPGLMSLADWRAIYRGSPIAIDRVARADVEAGLAALADAAEPPTEPDTGSPTVVELLQRSGDPLPAALMRLMVALKIAALGQGLSGVRWKILRALSHCLAANILPAVPAEAAGDRRALAQLFAVLTGTGDIVAAERPRSAAKLLKRAGLRPVKMSPAEKRALLSGSELSTAFALAGLFEAERLFQSALVSGALSTAAMRGPGIPPHARPGRLGHQAGGVEVAAALGAMLATEAPANSQDRQAPPAGVTEPNALPARMGACLDLLRYAGTTLERAGNTATEDRLVVWQTGEVVARSDEGASVVVAADLIALAVRELSGLAARRITLLANGAAGEVTATAPHVMVAGFIAEIRDRAEPAGFASESGSDEPALRAPGAPRLLRIAGTTSLVVAIEFLAAARACDRDAQDEDAAGPLAAVRRVLRDAVPQATDSAGISATDLAGAADLVRSGALAEAAGVALPSVATGADHSRRAGGERLSAIES